MKTLILSVILIFNVNLFSMEISGNSDNAAKERVALDIRDNDANNNGQNNDPKIKTCRCPVVPFCSFIPAIFDKVLKVFKSAKFE